MIDLWYSVKNRPLFNRRHDAGQLLVYVYFIDTRESTNSLVWLRQSSTYIDLRETKYWEAITICGEGIAKLQAKLHSSTTGDLVSRRPKYVYEDFSHSSYSVKIKIDCYLI